MTNPFVNLISKVIGSHRRHLLSGEQLFTSDGLELVSAERDNSLRVRELERIHPEIGEAGITHGGWLPSG